MRQTSLRKFVVFGLMYSTTRMVKAAGISFKRVPRLFFFGPPLCFHRLLKRSSLLADSETFSRGRGSVKLNVLLDSQTFIGTGTLLCSNISRFRWRGFYWKSVGFMSLIRTVLWDVEGVYEDGGAVSI